jgi:large subunit ribosomal protein L10
MNRTEKKAWIESLNEDASKAGIMIVAHYKGLTVAQISQLRVDTRKAGAKLKVTKNLLAKRALVGTPYAKLEHLFKGPTVTAFANEPVAAAKVLSDFAKKNEKLVLLGGAFGETVLDKAAINQLASLPSLDELRARILAMLNTPATRIAGVLQAPAGQLARLHGAKAAKGE